MEPFTIRLPDRSERKKGFNPIETGVNLVHRWLEDRKMHGSWGVLAWNKKKT
jgi:hypothetical protein